MIAREFTFANLERVAQAYADYLLQQSGSGRAPVAIIGFDRRFLSESFAQRAADVLAANGISIALFEQAEPTPLVSWTVKHVQADGGVVITASHNPPEFNGFKIKAPWGGSADPETTAAVERLVDKNVPKRAQLSAPRHELIAPAISAYRDHVKAYVDLVRLRETSFQVVVDSMHGSAGSWIESFLTGDRLRIETVRANRDPLFGGVNPEPIDQNLSALKRRVLETKALVGVATDGDADRLGAVDELGHTLTMHDVVPLLLLHLIRNRHMTGGVVRTFSQSVLLKRIAEAHQLRLYETPIGFKYIANLMLKENILIGAEESGGIGLKGHIPERDGVLNGLLFLEAIIAAGKPPSEMLRDLHDEFGEFHFGRTDLHIPISRGLELVERLATKPPVEVGGYGVAEVQTTDGTKLILADESWLLFRQSGTEPVLRIYAEGTSLEKMATLLDCGNRIAQTL